jgi:hypothetical protein
MARLGCVLAVGCVLVLVGASSAGATSMSGSATTAGGTTCNFTTYGNPGAFNTEGLFRNISYGTTLDCNGGIVSSDGCGGCIEPDTGTNLKMYDPVGGLVIRDFGQQATDTNCMNRYGTCCKIPQAQTVTSCDSGQSNFDAQHYTPSGTPAGLGNWQYEVFGTVYIRSGWPWSSYPQNPNGWDCLPDQDPGSNTGVLACTVDLGRQPF